MHLSGEGHGRRLPNTSPSPVPATSASVTCTVAVVGLAPQSCTQFCLAARECQQLQNRDSFSNLRVSLKLLMPKSMHELEGLLIAQEVHILLLAPGFATWSRMPALNSRGPRAIRSVTWPWGYPWLTVHQKEKCEADNAELIKMFTILSRFLKQPTAVTPTCVYAETEDLGKTGPIHPASCWRLRGAHRIAREHGLLRSAIFQCCLGHNRAQPTGLLHSDFISSQFTQRGWPKLDSGKKYAGPLAKRCSCRRKCILQRGVRQRSFNTSKGIVSPQLAYFLSQQLIRSWISKQNTKLGLQQDGGSSNSQHASLDGAPSEELVSDDSETTAEEPEDDPLDDGMVNDPLSLALDGWPYLSDTQNTAEHQTASGAETPPTKRSRTSSRTGPLYLT